MPRPRSDIRPRVLEAARAQFLQDGVEGASLRRIARAAHTSIGMIYYYFPTKDDLFLAVIEEKYEKILADLAVALTPDAPFEQRIERLYTRAGGLKDDELDVFKLVIREALLSTDRLGALIERFKRGHLALIAQTVADGFGDGTIAPSKHPGVVIMSVLAVGLAPQLVRRIAGGTFPIPGVPEGKELAHELAHILLHGIGTHREPKPETP